MLNPTESMQNIARLLLENRGGGTDWGMMADLKGAPCSKQLANKFLLCCLLDYQIRSEVAWANGERLIADILHDPDDIWKAITSVSEDEWKSKRAEYHLHRFSVAHNRLWKIADRVCEEYDGDARRIWEGRDSRTVLDALWDLGAGEQISRMVVGALRDCGQITGTGDVKADIYVCRVLGRAVLGKTTDPEEAVRLARRMNPADPWQLDAALWQLGKAVCLASNPICSRCYLVADCAYAIEHSASSSPLARTGSHATLRERLLALAKFIEPMEAPKFEFAKYEMGGYALSATAAAFVQATYDYGWILRDFDWPAWKGTDEAVRLHDDPVFLEQASAEQLAKLLTLIVRQDRFCDGLLNEVYESGFLIRILRRAEVLSHEFDKTGA
jgi:endonuclease III